VHDHTPPFLSTHPVAFSLNQYKVAMRSRLEPIKKVVATPRNHRALLLKWFEAQGMMSSGTVEGLNHKAKVVFRNAYGYRECNTIEIALYHTLGARPEPRSTYRFC
jgi:transposase